MKVTAGHGKQAEIAGPAVSSYLFIIITGDLLQGAAFGFNNKLFYEEKRYDTKKGINTIR